MTRQKQEIIKKMDEIDQFIDTDMELCHGCYPANAYDSLYAVKDRYADQLAQLRGYRNSAEEYNADMARHAQNLLHITSAKGHPIPADLPL